MNVPQCLRKGFEPRFAETYLNSRNSLSLLALSVLPHHALSELMNPLGNSLACESSISTCSEGDNGGSPISSWLPAERDEREDVAVLFWVAKLAVMIAVVVYALDVRASRGKAGTRYW
jgi:hypothetical protein